MHKKFLLTLAHLALSALLAGIFAVSATAQQSALPWLESIGARGRLADIHTISAEAAVTVSDGLTYTVNTVFHDRQRAVFRRVYADRTITQGVEGRYIWSFDGKAETEAPPFVEEFVLGHQLHAQLLFFDRLHPEIGTSMPAQFAGRKCMSLASENKNSSWILYYDPTGRPLGMENTRTKETPIIFKFDDWRPVANISLPFAILIDDGKRSFQYRYSSVKLNEGSLAVFRAAEEVLTEEQRLLRLHRIIMDDHLFGRTDGMKNVRGDSMVIVSDGEVYKMAGAESDAMLDRMMTSRDYTVYDDLIRPIVKISNDGSLGWVIAQVSASGVRFDANGKPSGPLEFVCAWIELYEKVQGRWRLLGNVSNFRPGRK